MERKKVWAVYFSATDTTKKTVLTIADEAARLLGAEREDYDFTLPGMRENGFAAGKDDLVIFGTPVYAGRVPNVLLKYLATIQGNGALAVPVVLFGNRNFDDGLIELRDILENTGFHTVAAAAFVGEHSFSKTLAAGRPDADDMKEALAFAGEQLLAQGALDISCAPLTMKKGRAGVSFTVLCKPRDEGRIAHAILRETTTNGVRTRRCGKYILTPSVKTVETAYGPIRVKCADGEGIHRKKPEYEDVASAARTAGLPFQKVWEDVLSAIRGEVSQNG